MTVLDYKYTHSLGKLETSAKWNHYVYCSFENEENYYKANG